MWVEVSVGHGGADHHGSTICTRGDPSVGNLRPPGGRSAYAFGGDGLSLWELLRIVRTGFVHSFMNLPERRAMLELADQILFDLFSRDDAVALLRELARIST